MADDAALREGYERLRGAVLSGRPDGFRLGHGVLATRGMLVWMRAFGSLAAPPASDGMDARGRVAPADGLVSAPGTDHLVAVLAQMTLAIAA